MLPENLQAEINCLKRQVQELRTQQKWVNDWYDTFNSPWYKRLWWWIQGFKLMSLGTWYNAHWNKQGQQYNKG